MNRFEKLFTPSWLTALLLRASLAACGGGGTNASTEGIVTAPAGVTVVPGSFGAPGGNAANPTVDTASPHNRTTTVATNNNSSSNVNNNTAVTATFSQAMTPA